jgi:metal-sulfur cluster biosynthetic enzyme
VDPSVEQALREVYDPCCREKGLSVVDMGLVHRARVDSGVARVELLLTSGWCPFAASVLTQVEDAVRRMPGVEAASVEIVWDRAWTTDRLSDAARAQLRFLPDPAELGERADPASYVAAVSARNAGGPGHPADRMRTQVQRITPATGREGASHDR